MRCPIKKSILASLLSLAVALPALAVDMDTCSFKSNPQAVKQLEVIVNASLTGKFDRKFLKSCLETAETCEEAFGIIIVLGNGITASAAN